VSVNSDSPGRSRSTREETSERILDAAEELFARREPARVTVREIAERAGVTHPLVHVYFGTKADIVNAVIARGAPQRQRIMVEHPTLREAVPLLAEDVVTRRVHSRSVVRSIMDDTEYVSLEARLETARMLLGLANDAVAGGVTRAPEAGAMDPRVVLAAFTALVFGWAALEDFLVEAFDLTDLDEARRQLGDIGLTVAELSLPPGGSSAG
jgi:TetR/AcrR family transcriptional regulator, repressor for neighboring sulfatase